MTTAPTASASPETVNAVVIERAATGYALFDCNGIPILPGDTVKVFHYVAAVRREKRYMYKFVLAVESRAEGKPPLMKLSHLNLKDEWYWVLMDGRRLESYEIVQGYGGVPSGNDYRDRERQKHNSD